MLTVSENGCEEQKLAQLTTALATTVISRLFIQHYKRDRQPMSIITLAKNGAAISWTRQYLVHPFEYLDDFITASQKNYFGCGLRPGYRLADPNKLLIKFDEKNTNVPSKIPVDSRFMTFQQFINICRNRVHRSNNNFFVFYMGAYQFINLVTQSDSLFQHKLKTILDAGVIFLLEQSEDPKQRIMAFYELESRTITLHANLMEEYTFTEKMNVFKHEVEHAYKDTIHQARWLIHPNTPMEAVFASAHGYPTPYFPFIDSEKQKWFALAIEGLNNTKKILSLLDKESSLNEEDKILLQKYKSAAKNYVHKLIHQRLCLAPNDPLNNLELQKKINADDNLVFTTSMTLYGLSIPFHIIKIIDYDSSQRLVVTCGYTTNGSTLKTPLYDLFFTFNLDMQLQKNYAELHAHIMGEYPPELVVILFEKLLAYDYADATHVLDTPIPGYASLLSSVAENTQNMHRKNLSPSSSTTTSTAAAPIQFLASLSHLTISDLQPPATLKLDDKSVIEGKSSSVSTLPKLESLMNKSDSPINLAGYAHENLIRSLKDIKIINSNDFTDFLEVINARCYNKAVLLACQNFNSEALDIIKIMLSYRGKLPISVNDFKGENGRIAIHYAGLFGNKPLYDVLMLHGANERQTDDTGFSANDYLQNHKFSITSQKPA